MFLTDLFEDDGAPQHVTIKELSGVPEKALGVLSRLAKFHQVSDLAFDRRSRIWSATDSEGLVPFVRDAKHITSAAGLGTRMASESMNEAYLSAAEAKKNPGVEVGNHVCIKDPTKPHSLKYAKLLRFGRSGLAMVLGNDGEKYSVPPSWVFASTEDAWPQPKYAKKPAQSSIVEGDVGDIIIKNKRGRAVGEVYNDDRLNTGSWCWHHYGYDLGYQGAGSIDDAIDALWEDEVDWVNERTNGKKKPVPFVRPDIK